MIRSSHVMPVTDSISWLAALAGGLAVLAISGRQLLTRYLARRQNTTSTIDLRGAFPSVMRKDEHAPRSGSSPDERLDEIAASLREVIRRLDHMEKRLARLDASSKTAGHAPAGSAGARPKEHAGTDPTYRRIYALADEGLTPVDIARRLNQHRGKVELILALRQG